MVMLCRRIMNFNSLSRPRAAKIKRQRDVAIGIAIACFFLLFNTVTIAKLGAGVLTRPL
jgi:hypothetical protein